MDSSDPHTQTNVSAYENTAREAFSAAAGSNNDDDAALWPQAPVQLARGRQPRDALAKIIPYSVSSMDEFETALREYLHAPPEQPEHTEAQLSFWIGTSFMVLAPSHANPQQTTQQQQHQQHQQHQHHQHHQHQHQQPPPHLAQQNPHAPPGYQPVSGFQAQYGGPSHAYQSVSDPAIALTLPPNFQQPAPTNGSNSTTTGKKPEHKVSLSIMEALQPTADPKDKMRKQRAIAKCCVDAIQRIDGYRYSFHNCWNSREDDSFRFSYYCNDSLLNKDRAANGKGAKLGKRATKPVYDCKGVLSIKFSATKETLDVFYKHVPVHKTYEERAPPPRKDSKRRKFLEENDPEALQRIINRPKEDSVEPSPRPKKKKPSKPEPPRSSNTSLESDLRAQSLQSLLLLIRDDPSAPPEPPPPEPEPAILQQPVTLQSPTQPPQNQLAQHQQQRKRPRNSCDVCKAKKTKCDGVRPNCQTCIDKKRQCFYSDPPLGDDRRQSMGVSEPVRPAPVPSSELSELEKMKRELEEAKARIQQLEQEKRASTTPVQTPQIATRPQSQPQPQAQPHAQPQQRPSIPHAQTQTHVQQPQQQKPQQQPQQQHQQRQSVAAQNHRQQLQQLNQVAQRRNSPQQMAYNLDGQPVQQQQQRLQSPRQSLQTAQQQQLQAAAQALPLQAQQSYFTAVNHTPYGALNRSMTQGSISSQTTQNPLSAQNSLPSSNSLGQTQQQAQLHNSGSLASGGSVDASSLYGDVGRTDLNWSPAAYYGYQSAQQQQQQQDQWGTVRGTNVFR